MIAKISSTENLGGALGYNFKKVEKGEASILLATELYQDNDGNYTMEDVLNDMEALIPKKGRTKKTVFHCSLNPHPDEKLSNEQLVQIAKEYMETLGYGKQPYIVFKHNDIAREHIHIVSLRVDGAGKKINDRFEKRRSKQITDALERKFGLIPSSKVTDKAMKEMPKIDTTQRNIKEQVSNIVRMVLKQYRINTTYSRCLRSICHQFSPLGEYPTFPFTLNNIIPLKSHPLFPEERLLLHL